MSEAAKDWLAIIILGAVFLAICVGWGYLLYRAAGLWGFAAMAFVIVVAWAIKRIHPQSHSFLGTSDDD